LEECPRTESYLALDDVALLEDLGNGILLLGTAKLSLKSSLGGGVEGALVAVPGGCVSRAVFFWKLCH
jgi:hypothetical protein